MNFKKRNKNKKKITKVYREKKNKMDKLEFESESKSIFPKGFFAIDFSSPVEWTEEREVVCKITNYRDRMDSNIECLTRMNSIKSKSYSIQLLFIVFFKNKQKKNKRRKEKNIPTSAKFQLYLPPISLDEINVFYRQKIHYVCEACRNRLFVKKKRKKTM